MKWRTEQRLRNLWFESDWWIYAELPDWLDDAAYWLWDRWREAMCRLTSHDIGPDQCGLPEHNYCYLCGASFPNVTSLRRWAA